jgi:hypothetical protein
VSKHDNQRRAATQHKNLIAFLKSEGNQDSENVNFESEIEVDESEEYPEDWGLE